MKSLMVSVIQRLKINNMNLNPICQGYQLTRDITKRHIKPPNRYGYADLITYALIAAQAIDDEKPKNFKEATQSKFKDHWLNVVGYLMYARPNISHAVSLVSRYMASPRREHWRAVKWIMRYLKGTFDCGLFYGKSDGIKA